MRKKAFNSCSESESDSDEPSQLREEVRKILWDADLTQTSRTHVFQELKSMGIDVKGKKRKVRQIIKQETNRIQRKRRKLEDPIQELIKLLEDIFESAHEHILSFLQPIKLHDLEVEEARILLHPYEIDYQFSDYQFYKTYESLPDDLRNEFDNIIYAEGDEFCEYWDDEAGMAVAADDPKIFYNNLYPDISGWGRWIVEVDGQWNGKLSFSLWVISNWENAGSARFMGIRNGCLEYTLKMRNRNNDWENSEFIEYCSHGKDIIMVHPSEYNEYIARNHFWIDLGIAADEERIKKEKKKNKKQK